MFVLLYILLSLGAVNTLIPLLIIIALIAAAAGANRNFSFFNLFGISTLSRYGAPGGKGSIQGKTAFSLPFYGTTFKSRGGGNIGKRAGVRLGRRIKAAAHGAAVGLIVRRTKNGSLFGRKKAPAAAATTAATAKPKTIAGRMPLASPGTIIAGGRRGMLARTKSGYRALMHTGAGRAVKYGAIGAAAAATGPGALLGLGSAKIHSMAKRGKFSGSKTAAQELIGSIEKIDNPGEKPGHLRETMRVASLAVPWIAIGAGLGRIYRGGYHNAKVIHDEAHSGRAVKLEESSKLANTIADYHDGKGNLRSVMLEAQRAYIKRNPIEPTKIQEAAKNVAGMAVAYGKGAVRRVKNPIAEEPEMVKKRRIRDIKPPIEVDKELARHEQGSKRQSQISFRPPRGVPAEEIHRPYVDMVNSKTSETVRIPVMELPKKPSMHAGYDFRSLEEKYKKDMADWEEQARKAAPQLEDHLARKQAVDYAILKKTKNQYEKGIEDVALGKVESISGTRELLGGKPVEILRSDTHQKMLNVYKSNEERISEIDSVAGTAGMTAVLIAERGELAAENEDLKARMVKLVKKEGQVTRSEAVRIGRDSAMGDIKKAREERQVLDELLRRKKIVGPAAEATGSDTGPPEADSGAV